MIPEIIQEKIILDSICLLKDKLGWKNIHDDIKSQTLYLKHTHHIFHDDFSFHAILRANTILYFVNKKTYTWLEKLYEGKYCYIPNHYRINIINDIYSTNSDGTFIDDDIDYELL
jgi:hypothetical protein